MILAAFIPRSSAQFTPMDTQDKGQLDDDLLSPPAAKSAAVLETDGSNVDRLYRDLATARGDAALMKFWKAKADSLAKDKANLAQRLQAAEERAERAEKALESFHNAVRG